MPTEAISPTTSRTYLYEGCYQARGELSFAQRAAWGRYGRHDAPGSGALFSLPQSPTQPPNVKRPQESQHQLLRAIYLPFVPPSVRAKRTWRIHAHARPIVRMRRKAPPSICIVRSKGVRWKRYRARALGRNVTLLIANGASFAVSSGLSVT